MTIILIIIGTVMLKISVEDTTWMQAAFLSVSSRTAGFFNINYTKLTSASILIICTLMLIGASPSSTGGGIKTTTVYTMVKSMISFSKGKQTIVKNKRISEESKLKAFTLFFFAISIIIVTSIVIMIIEEKNPNISFANVIFESFSAFATTGLSLGVTAYFTWISKLIICVLMFLGRLGPITIMGMWNSKWNKPNINNVEYLEEKIIIG